MIRVRDWAMFMGIMLVYTGLLSYAQTRDLNSAAVEARAIGVIQGMKAAQESSSLDREANALQWWTGSSDMGGVRERLCKNYYPKGKK